jgi:AraC-like DNA-binding protein
LHPLKLTGTLYCRAELTAPWGIRVPDLEDCSTLQIVSWGRAWLDVQGAEPRWLERGSVSFVPGGTPHCITSGPGIPAEPLESLPVAPVSERYETLNHGGGGDRCQITYGVVRFDDVASRRLLDHLPRVLQVDALDPQGRRWLHDTAQLAIREASHLHPGGEAVLTRLTDILVVQCIRAWLDSAPEAQVGWLAALRDPPIGAALAAMHHAPAEPWTVASLARHVHMSRSAFSARFRALLGQPVMQYLTEWRMQSARIRIRGTDAPLADVAEEVGYASEAAFSRAFRRCFGVPPGELRRPPAARTAVGGGTR